MSEAWVNLFVEHADIVGGMTVVRVVADGRDAGVVE